MELHYFMAVFHEVAGRKVKGEANETENLHTVTT